MHLWWRCLQGPTQINWSGQQHCTIRNPHGEHVHQPTVAETDGFCRRQNQSSRVARRDQTADTSPAAIMPGKFSGIGSSHNFSDQLRISSKRMSRSIPARWLKKSYPFCDQGSTSRSKSRSNDGERSGAQSYRPIWKLDLGSRASSVVWPRYWPPGSWPRTLECDMKLHLDPRHRWRQLVFKSDGNFGLQSVSCRLILILTPPRSWPRILEFDIEVGYWPKESFEIVCFQIGR